MENSLTCALAEARFFSNSSASSSRFSMAGEILKRPLQIAKEMARPARVERATHCLEGSCSIQLSYGRSGQLFRTLPPQGQARLVRDPERWSEPWLCELGRAACLSLCAQPERMSGPLRKCTGW